MDPLRTKRRRPIEMKRRRPPRKPITCILSMALASWAAPTGVADTILGEPHTVEGEIIRTVPPKIFANLFPKQSIGDPRHPHIGYNDDDGMHSEFPTDTAMPSPSPSMVPSWSPTKNTPSPTPPPTSRPTVSTPLPTTAPTGQPTVLSTPMPTPTFAPTSVPSFFPTPGPTDSPTVSPVATSMPTAMPSPPATQVSTTLAPTTAPLGTTSPTIAPSQSPAPSQVSSPTTPRTFSPTVDDIDVDSPTQTPTQTQEPTSKQIGTPTTAMPTTGVPNVSPSSVPSVSPSSVPSVSPSMSSAKPSNFEPSETPAPVKPVPVQVPLPAFQVGLALSSSETDVDALAEELDTVLTDYLTEGLAESLGVDEEALGVDLTVTPVTQRRRKRRNLRYLVSTTPVRLLQEPEGSTAVFDVTGTVLVDNQSDLSNEEVTDLVNDAVEENIENFDDEEFTEYVQTHPDSDQLQNVTGATAEVQEPPPDNNSSQPSVVAIVFGCLLCVLGLAMTVGYGYVFWKKYQKRQAKREQQKLVAQPRPSSTKEASSRKRSMPSFRSRSPVRSVPPTQEDDDSSNGPVGTSASSSSGEDSFARELKWAASLDRKVWEDYEKQTKQLEDEGKVVGQDPPMEPYSQHRMVHAPSEGEISYYDAQSTSREPMQIFQPTLEENRATVYASPLTSGAAAGVAGGIALNSFPYGDEESSSAPTEEGVEWTTAGIAVADRGEGVEQKADENSSEATPYNEGWSDVEVPPTERGVNPTGWSDASTGTDTEIRDLMEELEAIKAEEAPKIKVPAENKPMRFSDPFAFGTDEDKAADRSAPGALEASTDSSSVSSETSETAGAVYRPSPDPTSTTSGAVRVPNQTEKSIRRSRDGDVVFAPPAEEESHDSESLLTSEIVREVQLLSRFVRRYEKKREKKGRKRKEGDQSPSMGGGDAGYDSLADTAGALGKAHGGASQTNELYLSSPVHKGGDDNIDGDSSSSDESSLFSSESDGESSSDGTDVSMGPRLGISPFKVQDPTSVSTGHVSEKTGPDEAKEKEPKSPVSGGTRGSQGHITSLVNSARVRRESRRDSPPKKRSPPAGSFPSPGPSYDMEQAEADILRMNASLSSLRHNDSILDNSDSDANFPMSNQNERNVSGARVTPELQSPFSVPSVRNKSKNGPAGNDLGEQRTAMMNDRGSQGVASGTNRFSVPSPNRNSGDFSTEFEEHRLTPDEGFNKGEVLESKSEIRRKRREVRSGNQGFKSIISLFESKPKDAIFPPNESWQYNY